MTRAVIVDDETIVGEGLARMLAAAGCEVVGTATTIAAAVTLVRGLRPDLVVADLMFDGRPDGLTLVPLLAQLDGGAPPVMFLSSWDMPYLVGRARSAGAAGYLPKTIDLGGLVRAIEAVKGGQSVYPAQSMASEQGPSAREIQVIRLVAAGFTSIEIAGRLRLSPRSIEGHLSRLFERYSVSGRTRLVSLAVQQGWVTTTEIAGEK